MGRPGQRTSGKAQFDPSIQHFSHNHQLQLMNTKTQPSLNSVSCAGCKLQPSEWVYACEPCNFVLHIPCSQLPTLIRHPADPNHTFTLLAKPTYPTGQFGCDACGNDGDGFSYSCSTCGIDIHILCATKPLSLTHKAHRCPLNLTFSPDNPSKTFSCNICQREGFNHWVYRCNPCEFDAHLHCATQNPSALPVSSQNQTRSLVHPQAQSSLHQQAEPQPHSTLYQQEQPQSPLYQQVQPQPQPHSSLYQQPQSQRPLYQQAQAQPQPHIPLYQQPQPQSSLHQQAQPQHLLYQQPQPQSPLYPQVQPQPQPNSPQYQQPQSQRPLYQQAQPQPHSPLYQQQHPQIPLHQQAQPQCSLYQQPQAHSPLYQQAQPQPHNPLYQQPQSHSPFRYQHYVQPIGISAAEQRNSGGIITSQVQSLLGGNSVTGAVTRQCLQSIFGGSHSGIHSITHHMQGILGGGQQVASNHLGSFMGGLHSGGAGVGIQLMQGILGGQDFLPDVLGGDGAGSVADGTGSVADVAGSVADGLDGAEFVAEGASSVLEIFGAVLG